MTEAIFYLNATGSSETMPQIDSTGTEAMTTTLYVLDNLDTADLVEASAVAVDSGARQACPTFAPTDADTFVMYFGMSDKDYREIAFLPPVAGISSYNDDDQTTVGASWFFHQPAATTTTQHYTVADYQTTRIIFIAVAFNITAGYEVPCVDPDTAPGDLVSMMSRGSTDYLGGAFSDPTASILPTIDGVATVYKLPSTRDMPVTDACEIRGTTIYNATVNTHSIGAVGRSASIDLSSSLVMGNCWDMESRSQRHGY